MPTGTVGTPMLWLSWRLFVHRIENWANSLNSEIWWFNYKFVVGCGGGNNSVGLWSGEKRHRNQNLWVLISLSLTSCMAQSKLVNSFDWCSPSVQVGNGDDAIFSLREILWDSGTVKPTKGLRKLMQHPDRCKRLAVGDEVGKDCRQDGRSEWDHPVAMLG